MKRIIVILLMAGVGILLYLTRNQAKPGDSPSNGAAPVQEGVTPNGARVLRAGPGAANAIIQLAGGTNGIGSQAYELQCLQEYDRLSRDSVPDNVLYTAIRRTYVAVSERKQYQDLIESEIQSLTDKLNRLQQSEELSESQRQSLQAVQSAASRTLVETLRAKANLTVAQRAQELLELTGLPDRRTIDLALAITPVQYAPFMPTNAP